MTRPIFETTLCSEADTIQLAQRIAPLLRAGDVVLLEGDIGAGKSSFCRAAIKTLCGPEEDVPSPTFTLVQIYDAADVEIWHADLYRLSDPAECIELGLTEAFDSAICLVEWPDRLEYLRPPSALTLTLAAGDAGHHIAANGPAAWAKRLDLINA